MLPQNGGIMKKSFKFLLSLLLLSFFVSGLFAEGYHVCLASYQKLSNAQEMVRKLENQSLSAFINENKVKNKTYYRVLLSKEFKKIEDARKYRDEVSKYSFVKELKLKDFWVCKADKNLAPKSDVPAPAPKKEVKIVPAPAPVPKPQPKPVEIKPEPKIEPIPEPPVKNIEPEPAPIPEPEPLPAPEPAPIEPIIVNNETAESNVLDKNEKAVLSEKTPYSVLVRSYKYSQFAENDSARLKELGFDSYLLNTFDDTSFFAFNIHVGAFETREEAETLKNQFTDAGILGTEISDYNEIKPKIEKYDEIITSKNVTFDDGRTDLPTVIPASTEKLVSHFPANKDFQIKEISILDYDNYLTSGSKPDINSPILDYIGESAAVHSALLATYRDELYQKEVTVFLTNADNFAFNEGVEPSGEKIQLTSSKGNLESDLYEKDGELVLCGVNSAENVYVRMQTKDFIKEEFTSFLNESFTDSNLSLYPQLRRTLFVLPDQNTAAARGFISFNLKNVGDDYANDRGYAAWSLPIVGHALAKTYFIENSNLFCIGFYDLDYDFNAEQVHAHFTEAKNTVEISESNQSVSVNGVDGWYLLNPEQKEVSFSTKSYIIAIDAESNSTLTKEDLIRAGTDLKIWNAAAVIDAK